MLVTRRGALVGLCGAGLSMAVGPALDALSPRSSRVSAADADNRAGVGEAVGQSAPAVRTISLGQSPIDLVLDPAPSRDAPDGRIFVSIQGPTDPYSNPMGVGIVRALDARDGRTVRDVRVGYAPGPLALDERTGHLFVVNRSERTVSMLDARGSAAPRAIIVPPGPRGIAVDSRAGRAILVGGGVTGAGNVQIGSGSGSLLDTANGRVLSEIPVAGQPDTALVDARRGYAFINAGALTILDIARGRVARAIPLAVPLQALTLDETTGRLFAITPRANTPVNSPTAYNLTMLDGQNGRALSSIAIEGNPTQIAVDVNAGRVIVFGGGFIGGLEINVADTRAGRLPRTVMAPNVALGTALNAGLPAPPVVDARRGHVYIALTDPSSYSKAYVGMCDTRSGALLHTIPVRGSDIQAMTADERSGRLFVISVAQGPNPQGYLTIIGP